MVMSDILNKLDALRYEAYRLFREAEESLLKMGYYGSGFVQTADPDEVKRARDLHENENEPDRPEGRGVLANERYA